MRHNRMLSELACGIRFKRKLNRGEKKGGGRVEKVKGQSVSSIGRIH